MRHAVAIVEALSEDGALVPSIWPLEVANAFLSKSKRGLMSRHSATHMWRIAMELPVRMFEPSIDDLESKVLPLAMALN